MEALSRGMRRLVRIRPELELDNSGDGDQNQYSKVTFESWFMSKARSGRA
jgi:hypothetical protein